MHRPPIAFVGRSAPVRRLVKTTTFDSILLIPHGPQQHQKQHQQQQQAMQADVMLTKLWTSSSSSSTQQQEDEDMFVEAQDLDALQQLFSKYCDKEGLMSKQNLEQIPAIAQLLVRYIGSVEHCDFILFFSTAAKTRMNIVRKNVSRTISHALELLRENL